MKTSRDSLARDEPRGKAEAVLAAAERAFLAAGFGAVTMDAVARSAGVSKATVYAHYGSKEALFGAVVAGLSERRFDSFSVEALDSADLEAALTAIATQFLDLVLSPEGIALNRIIIAEVIRFPALGAAFWGAGPERIRGQIEAFLRHAAIAGSLEIANPRLAAEQFVALARGEIHLRSLLRLEDPGDPAVLEAAAEGAVATFLRAFAPQSPVAEVRRNETGGARPSGARPSSARSSGRCADSRRRMRRSLPRLRIGETWTPRPRNMSWAGCLGPAADRTSRVATGRPKRRTPERRQGSQMSNPVQLELFSDYV